MPRYGLKFKSKKQFDIAPLSQS